MKKILITGADSYIGGSLERFLSGSRDYSLSVLDMTKDSWQAADFSGYDAVFHVAGIVHTKEKRQNRGLYYKVNRDLAMKTAEKAKASGVGQFIFLSSMSIYGKNEGIITKETLPAPDTHYGRSKLLAEQRLCTLRSGGFRLAILRPPMVYGKNCKGNFARLVKIADTAGFFPEIANRRSMIYIDNLCSFVKMAIDCELDGVFFPQNREPACTSDIIRIIARQTGRTIKSSGLLSAAAMLGVKMGLPALQKAFGTLLYENTEDFDYKYCVCSFEESVKRSV